MLQKWKEWGYKVLPHPPHSPDLLSSDYHFKHFDNFFARKTLPQSAGGRKCFPRVPRILRHGFLFYRNKQIYFSLAIMFIVMIPILINKDVSEPTYMLALFLAQLLTPCVSTAIWKMRKKIVY